MDLCEKIKSGPIKPALSYKSTELSKPVRIRYDSGCSYLVPGGNDEEPITIPELFCSTVEKYSNKSAIHYKDKKNLWQTITYQDYYMKVLTIAKRLIQLGLESNECIGILASNCPEWFYIEMGGYFAGAIIAGIYTTNSPDAVHHALELSGAKFVFVDDHFQMEKILEIKNRLPKLKFAIQINGPYQEELFSKNTNQEEELFSKDKTQENGGNEDISELKFLKWSDFVVNCNDLHGKKNFLQVNGNDNIENNLNEKLLKRINEIAPNQCCLLIYTSGTIGYPKAVMLSHDNLITNARNGLKTFPNVCYADERMVSYLPLNHIVAQTFDVFITLLMGGAIYFAEKDAMKGSLMNTIAKAKPTRFFGVPRVFEKMQDKIFLVEKQNYGFLQAILNWAKYYSADYNLTLMNGTAPKSAARYWFAQNILTSIKTSFGLEKCKYFLTLGASSSHKTKQFFLEYDIRLFEAYGLSETAGGMSVGDEQIRDFDVIGRPLNGVKFKVLEPNENGYGEICVKSRSNFMGYLNEIEKTDETLDSEGYLHTGDYGYLNEQGYLYLTGRIKEILITSGGENIPPYHVENLIKAELPGINNVFLVGDRRKYLTILLSIKTNIEPNTGSPLDQLHDDALEWIKSLNLKYKTLSEILNSGPCSKVQYAIADGIKRANLKAISNAQKVQKFRILPNDFSMITGELGPTLKVKRNFVLEKYSKLIEEMYKE